jgi:hypothetical protein
MLTLIEKKNNCFSELALFESLGLDRPYPHARFLLKDKNESRSVLRVSPLSLEASHNDATITDLPETLLLDESEYQKLFSILTDYFDGYGFQLIKNHQQEWLLFHDKEIESTPLYHVKDKPLLSLMPHGKDKLFWARLFTECQMLFESHPFLKERANQGKPVINGIWFWGESADFSFDKLPQLITDDDTLRFWLCENQLDKVISYDSYLDLSTLNLKIPTVFYINNILETHAHKFKRLQNKRTLKWRVYNENSCAIKGSQDENNKKKRNKRHNRVSRFASFIATYLFRQRH